MRGEVAKANRNQTWFGSVIGVHQTTAGRILKGLKPMTMDELTLACLAIGRSVSDLVSEAESNGLSATRKDDDGRSSGNVG